MTAGHCGATGAIPGRPTPEGRKLKPSGTPASFCRPFGRLLLASTGQKGVLFCLRLRSGSRAHHADGRAPARAPELFAHQVGELWPAPQTGWRSCAEAWPCGPTSGWAWLRAEQSTQKGAQKAPEAATRRAAGGPLFFSGGGRAVLVLWARGGARLESERDSL